MIFRSRGPQSRREALSIIVAPARGRTRQWNLSRQAVRGWIALGGLAVLSLVCSVLFLGRLVVQESVIRRLSGENSALHSQLSHVDALEKELSDLTEANRRMRRLVGLEEDTPNSNEPSVQGPGRVAGSYRSRKGVRWSPSPPHLVPHHGPISRGFSDPGDDGASHPGIDVSGSVGMPIVASGSGLVKIADNDSTYGNRVIIDHGGGLMTVYGHASELLVATGDTVMEGQEIALLGSTGKSSAPHLHFEVLKDGKPVDPGAYVKEYARR